MESITMDKQAWIQGGGADSKQAQIQGFDYGAQSFNTKRRNRILVRTGPDPEARCRSRILVRRNRRGYKVGAYPRPGGCSIPNINGLARTV